MIRAGLDPAVAMRISGHRRRRRTSTRCRPPRTSSRSVWKETHRDENAAKTRPKRRRT